MKVIHFNKIDSTQNEAKRLLSNGSITENTVITADTQSRGRGQFSRTWESNTGGLYLSFIYIPITHLPENITVKIGHLLAKTLSSLSSLTIEPEWPNDLILEDKKCGGILVESIQRASDKLPKAVIIGLGVNLNQTEFSDNLKATAIALRQKTKIQYNKLEFRDKIVSELENALKRNTWSHNS